MSGSAAPAYRGYGRSGIRGGVVPGVCEETHHSSIQYRAEGIVAAGGPGTPRPQHHSEPDLPRTSGIR